MSYYHVPAPGRRRVPWRAIGLVIALSLIAALAAGWSAARPLSITVDGKRVSAEAGTTVARLEEQGLIAARPGDLLGVSGSVVETAGGLPPRVQRNGKHAAPWQRVFEGDVIVSARGSDRTESLVVTETPIPFERHFEGEGSIVQMKRLGSPGMRRVTMGERSGTEVTSTVLVEPIHSVFVRTQPRPSEKLVALTFDDGPQKGQTDRALDILKKHKVKATFFVIGSQVRAHPSTVRRMVREGHQVANHSFAHRKMAILGRKAIRQEVLKGRYAIRDAAGVRTPWFRPPYGAIDKEMWDELERLDQRVVMWDVDPMDWSRPGTKKIVDNVVANVKPGSIVLLHDGGADRRQTMAALPVIIRKLKAKGYTFVTVEELAAAKP